MRAGGHRISDIEILRAVAILGVMQVHTIGNLTRDDWIKPAGINGWLAFATGVNLFFVVSGFVVTRSLLPALRGAGSLRHALARTWNFWIARLWRLTPSAWFWLLVILAGNAVFGSASLFGAFGDNVEAALAGAFDYADFHFASCFGTPHCGTSFQYWTLSLEEQFYVALPVVILLGGRALPLLVALAAIWELARPIVTLIAYTTRFGGLALGVGLALIEGGRLHARLRPRLLERHAPLRWLVFAGCVLTIGFAGAWRFPLPAYRTQIASLAGAVLVLVASYDRDMIGPRRVGRALLERIGHRSYALYLSHVSIIVFLRIALAAAGLAWLSAWVTVPVFFVLSYAVADANYRLLERRLRARLGAIGMIRVAAADARASGGVHASLSR